MIFNIQETAFMSITSKKTHLHFTYDINNSSLCRAHEYKYLGITFQHNLRWDSHIASITHKAIAKLKYLRRVLKYGAY